MSAFVLRDTDTLEPRLVGGKISRQRRLTACGLNVPRFFCITREAFDRALEPIRGDLRARLADLAFDDAAAVHEAALELQARVRATGIEPGLSQAALAAFDELFATETLVAVRASTVADKEAESEDSLAHSFAGLSATSLYVRREDLLDRVLGCWCGAFSAESLLYRSSQGLDPVGFGVAVAVQRMVMGARSFVMFTADPKTGSRDTVIIAGHGIGEGVVQERVAVDHFFVNARTGRITSEIAHKEERLTLDARAGHGLASAAVPEGQRDRPCLGAAEVAQLTEDGRRVAAAFGAPQDIEGTITASGERWYVQTRPIVFDYRRLRVWTNANVTESFPGATTALTYSFARFFYRVIFTDCYRRLGLGARRIALNHDEFLERMIGFLEGRVYYNLNAFYHLHSESPLFPLFRAHWEQMMGFRTSYRTKEETVLRRLGARIAAGFSFLSAGGVVGVRYLTHDRAMARFHRWWNALIGPLRAADFEEQPPLVVIGEFHRVWREVGRMWGVTLLNDTYLPVVHGIVEGMLRRWGLAEDQALFGDLLCGGETPRSVEIVLSAVAIATRVRGDAELQARVARATPDELWAAVRADDIDAGFAADVREHLARYGDRGLQELKIEQPNLRDAPELLLQSIQQYAAGELTVEALCERDRAAREAGEGRLRRALGGHPLRRAQLRFGLRTLRRLICHRENSRYCRSELFGFAKRVFRVLGRYLERRDVLASADDVYHLTQDELFGYFDGTGVTQDLGRIAELRRGEFGKRQEVETPLEVSTLGPVGDASHAARGPAGDVGERLQGLGSSSGRVRGVARVVLDPAADGVLGQDAILVARETDPGWLFLMLGAKGIVVERGSMLSHTAITGRKFGIPTVVAVPDATTRIPDGARVEIDGAAGTVEVLS